MGALLTDAYLEHKNKKDNNKKNVEMDDDHDEVADYLDQEVEEQHRSR